MNIRFNSIPSKGLSFTFKWSVTKLYKIKLVGPGNLQKKAAKNMRGNVVMPDARYYIMLAWIKYSELNPNEHNGLGTNFAWKFEVHGLEFGKSLMGPLS